MLTHSWWDCAWIWILYHKSLNLWIIRLIRIHHLMPYGLGNFLAGFSLRCGLFQISFCLRRWCVDSETWSLTISGETREDTRKRTEDKYNFTVWCVMSAVKRLTCVYNSFLYVFTNVLDVFTCCTIRIRWRNRDAIICVSHVFTVWCVMSAVKRLTCVYNRFKRFYKRFRCVYLL